MKIFILRHGESEPMRAGHTDKHRALTLNGREQVARIGFWMNKHGYSPELIISSPFKRTRQTSQILHEMLDIKQPVEFEEALLSERDPMEMFNIIQTLDVSSVLLTSHMPLVEELTCLLAPGAIVNGFSTASIVKIRYDKESQHGTLTANIAPFEV